MSFLEVVRMEVESGAREWETFEGGPTPPQSERLHVTLSTRCILLMNRNTFEALGGPAAVKLMFDRSGRTIGVRPARDGEAKPFPLKPNPRDSHFAVHAKPFCRHYDVIPERAVKFAEPWFDGGVLVLSLDRTEIIPLKRRRINVAAVVRSSG